MAFRLPKLPPLSVPFIAGIVLVVGLSFVVVALQQPQDSRSRADWTGGQCNLQGQSSQNCCSNVNDIISRTGWTDVAGAGTCHDDTVYSCPGGRYVPSNIWLCPGGNNIRCCVPIVQAPPPPPADTTAPSVPVNLNGTVISATEIDLTWNASTDNVGVTGYKVFRNGTQIATVTTGTNYQDKTGLVQGTTYTYTVNAFDAAGNNSAKSNEISKTTLSLNTAFSFTLLLHGIGKGGDNRNPTAEGNLNPIRINRNVTVEVYEPGDTTTPFLSKTGQITYNSTPGNFTGTIDMGSTLTTKTYIIKVITQSLRGSTTRAITVGTTNTIPSFALVNGDANGDGQLDVEDYNYMLDCFSDFGITPPPSQCGVSKKQSSDLDDDGTVGIFDVNLMIREFSVQVL